MKSLGEILKSARTESKISLADISASTKIEEKYLKALEENDYQHLPPPTFTKGFIRKYAQFIGKDPSDLVAIYRRDYHYKPQKPEANKEFSIKGSLLSVSKSTLIFTFLGITVFLGYLAFQYRAIITPPKLELSQPAPDAILTSPVFIEGRTTPDSLITINGDTTIKPDQSGVFTTQFEFAPGNYQLTVEATNRFSRTNTKQLDITVISK